MAGRNAVKALLAELPSTDTIAVACSGGADSLAVAASLVFVARRTGHTTAAFIIDHNMQEGSAQVAAEAAESCTKLGIDIVEIAQVHVASGPNSGGPEAAARNVRYHELERLAAKHQVETVLLGHTIDDQAETVLLGLARGSGARSLAGMRAQKGIFHRPFLGITRAETEAICQHEGLNYWIDPTNLEYEDGPLRSQVRGTVVPMLDRILGPGIVSTLARTAEQLNDDAHALEQLAQEAFAKATIGTFQEDETQITLSVSALLKTHHAIRTRALRFAAISAGSSASALNYKHVADLDRLLTHWHGQGPISLPGGASARRQSGNIVIKRPTV